MKYGLDRVAYHEKNGKIKDEFTEQNTKKPESTAVEKEKVVKEPTQQEDRIDAIRWRYRENPKQAE